MAVPLFAYSDVDAVEFELLASKMEDVEYKKGDAVARKGDSVVPALYIVRSGEIVSHLQVHNGMPEFASEE